MICRSDLRTCLGAMFNKLRANDEQMWMLVHAAMANTYALYNWDDKDIPWPGIESGDTRIVLCMSRLELMVLLSEPVMGMFKESRDANAAPSVPTRE